MIGQGEPLQTIEKQAKGGSKVYHCLRWKGLDCKLEEQCLLVLGGGCVWLVGGGGGGVVSGEQTG